VCSLLSCGGGYWRGSIRGQRWPCARTLTAGGSTLRRVTCACMTLPFAESSVSQFTAVLQRVAAGVCSNLASSGSNDGSCISARPAACEEGLT